MKMQGICRLNWACGNWTPAGWINSDQKDQAGVDLVCDIRDGFPLDHGSVDIIACIHTLPEFAYDALVPTLEELHRVLKPNGTLRIAVPDLDVSIRAYLRGDTEHFQIPDWETRSLGAKFARYLTWYGYTRSVFTYDYLEEMLFKARFRHVVRCAFKETPSGYPEIVDLDNRETESLFVEAMK